MDRLGTIIDAIGALTSGEGRVVVAVAGPPGSGKSTLAEHLERLIHQRIGPAASAILPMDGYHFDNAVITPRGLLARKGAPETFDFAGYRAMLQRLRARADDDVAVPVFDRELDLARAGARIIGPAQRIVVTEGNYLLLETEPWTSLRPLFDLTIFLQVPVPELERRLIDRWIKHGLPSEQAAARARGNDMPNARLVMEQTGLADFVVEPRDM
jgi:pantothenate kinase